jgi:Kef-type K+ transport system membrane component KefB
VLARLIPRRLVPPAVIEALAGMAIGPQGLNLVQPTGGIYVLYLLGFGFLLFLAGEEVEVRRFRGPTFRLTAASFVISVALAFPIAAGVAQIAPGADVRLLALALTASSLGVMVPVLRDAHEIDTDFGQLAIMAGSVGEFAALLLLTILFSAQPEAIWVQVAYVVALGVAAIIGAVVLRRLWRSALMRRTLLATDQSTSQLRVRGGFVILLAFTALAHRFGVDALLGAFVGGVVLNIADSDDRPTQERYRASCTRSGTDSWCRSSSSSRCPVRPPVPVREPFVAGAHASAHRRHPHRQGRPGDLVPAEAGQQARGGRGPAAGHHADLPGRGG